MTKPDDSGVDLDGIFQELGHFGKYQIINYSFILVPIIFSAIYTGQYVFNAANVPYRCRVPECESSPATYETDPWGKWALPSDPRVASCERFAPRNHTCSANGFHEYTLRCDSWVYQSHHTIVAEFDLACQEWKRTLVGTIHSAGLFAALPLTGLISDAFGRRNAFVLSAMSVSFIGVIRSFSVNYAMYMVFEFLDAVFASGVFNSGFILAVNTMMRSLLSLFAWKLACRHTNDIALEAVGLKGRVLGGNLITCSFAVGQITLALFAWAIPDWKTLTRVLYAPSIVFIFYYYFIEESIRWLLSKGKKKEAAKIIFKAAIINKKKLSQEYIKQLTEDSAEEQKPKEPSISDVKAPSLLWQVLKSRIIMSRLCICSFWWITLTFIYYGLSINSVSLGGNSYVNYMLMSMVEIPGYCLSVLTLDRFGRKISIMTAFFICGFSLVAFPFVPDHLQWLATSLNMLGKLCISMAFSSIYIYTSELFPTTARHSLLAFCSMVGRIGSIIAPQTPLLMAYMASLPYLIFGLMAVCSGLLMTLTPETLRMKLPDTIAQAENISLLEVVDLPANSRTDVTENI